MPTLTLKLAALIILEAVALFLLGAGLLLVDRNDLFLQAAGVCAVLQGAIWAYHGHEGARRVLGELRTA